MSLRQKMFMEPRGIPGAIGARMMASASKSAHHWAIELLDPRPGQHILEIGPAHGALIQRMDEGVPDLRFSAIDPSPDMVKLAAKRNGDIVDEDRLDVREGRVSAIPFEAGKFDGVVTTHTVYFWPDPAADMREVVRVTRPGGRVVVIFRAVRDSEEQWCVAETGGTDVPSGLTIATLRSHGEEAGLTNVRASLRHIQKRGLFGKPTFGAVIGEKES